VKVGPYDVLRKLGEGAYGKVYLARKGERSGFATWYALKRISRGKARGQDFEAYLQREARVGGLVNHPNLVRVHEVISLKKEWVLVQDYVDGVTLSAVLTRWRDDGTAVPREAALELVAELLETLHYLHTLRDPEGREFGFVHRDVKPGNVMLTSGHGIRVMDFGVARGEEAGAGTLAGELRGTIAYMAPEQATGGEVGPGSDQFAAGLILVEMLTGGSAWGDVRGAAVLGKVVTGDVSHGLMKLAEAHDEELLEIAQRMLSRDPATRYGSAHDAADALRHLRARTPTPPALRGFCVSAVEALRVEREDPFEDDEPSWTGRWPAAEGERPSPRDSLGPAGLSLATPVVEDDYLHEPGFDLDAAIAAAEDDQPSRFALAAVSGSQPPVGQGEAQDARAEVSEPQSPVTQEPVAAITADDAARSVPAAAAGDPSPESDDEELDLEEDGDDPIDDDGPSLGNGGAGLAVVDESSTLPLDATPAQRAALLAALNAAAEPKEKKAPLVGTGESLEAVQRRLAGIDAEQTLPIPAGAPSASDPGSAPASEVSTASEAAAESFDPAASMPSAPPLAEEPRPGEPARAGAYPAPTATGSHAPIAEGPAPPKRKRKRKRRPAEPEISIGAALWQQFVASPLLGSLVLLFSLAAILTVARFVWMAVVPSDEVADTDEVAEDDLLLPSERAALEARARGEAPGPPPSIEGDPDAPTPDEAVAEAGGPLSEDELSALGDADPDAEGEAEPDGDAVAAAAPEPEFAELDASGAPSPAPPPSAAREPAPVRDEPVDTAGADLDEDLASWRGEEEQPTPPPRKPTEGEIIAGSGAGERLLEDADGERNVATRRDDGEDDGEAQAAAAAGPRLRFLSSDEQPVGVPLSVRVRSDGFYATSVVVYYQWRSEGAAARKRRSLRQQPDGSFALEIPASELRVDRLQLWFSAEPGPVDLGTAGSPLEVRVR